MNKKTISLVDIIAFYVNVHILVGQYHPPSGLIEVEDYAPKTDNPKDESKYYLFKCNGEDVLVVKYEHMQDYTFHIDKQMIDFVLTNMSPASFLRYKTEITRDFFTSVDKILAWTKKNHPTRFIDILDAYLEVMG